MVILAYHLQIAHRMNHLLRGSGLSNRHRADENALGCALGWHCEDAERGESLIVTTGETYLYVVL
jgi:hypothetical protein